MNQAFFAKKKVEDAFAKMRKDARCFETLLEGEATNMSQELSCG